MRMISKALPIAAMALVLAGCGYEKEWRHDAYSITISAGSYKWAFYDSESNPLSYRTFYSNDGAIWNIEIRYGSSGHCKAVNFPYVIEYKGESR